MRKTKWLFAAAAVLLTSCGPSRPDFDEAAFLAANGFADPLSIAVDLGRFGDYSENSRIIAALARAGYVGVTSNTNAAPWWNFTVAEGDLQGTTLTIAAGKRVLSGHSDEKRWTEGSLDYFAETISYKLELDPRIEKLIGAQNAGKVYSFRLVIANDPASGRWTFADRGNNFNQGDVADLGRALAEAGDPAQLSPAIGGAQQQADRAIAQQVMAALGLSVDGKSPIVRQRDSHRAYLIDDMELPAGATFAKAKAYCAGQTRNGLPWHMATLTEIKPLFLHVGDNWIMDSPRRDIWGSFLQPQTAVVLNTWTNNAMFGPGPQDNPPGDAKMDGYWYFFLLVQDDGKARTDSTYQTAPSDKLDDVIVQETSYVPKSMKVLCVADTP